MLESVIFLSFEKLGKNNKLKSTEKVNLSLKYFLWKLLSTYEGENEFCETTSTLSQKFDVSNASISNFLDTLTNAEYIKKTSTENMYSTAKGAQYSYEFTAYLNKELEDVKKACNRKHSHKIQLVLSEHFYTGLEKRLYEFKSDNLIVKDFRPMQMLLVILLSLSNASGVVLNLGLKQLSTLCGLGKGKLKKHIDYLIYIGLIRRVDSGGTGHKLLGKCTSIYFLNLSHQIYDNYKSSAVIWANIDTGRLNTNKIPINTNRLTTNKQKHLYKYQFLTAFSEIRLSDKFSITYTQELLNLTASKLLKLVILHSDNVEQLQIHFKYLTTLSFKIFIKEFCLDMFIEDIEKYMKALNINGYNEFIYGSNELTPSKTIDESLDEEFTTINQEFIESFNSNRSQAEVKQLLSIYILDIITIVEESLNCVLRTKFDFEDTSESNFNIHKFPLTSPKGIGLIVEHITGEYSSIPPSTYLLNETEQLHCKIKSKDKKELTICLQQKYGLLSKVNLTAVDWGSFDK
jgi:predicted transcriptional regulator